MHPRRRNVSRHGRNARMRRMKPFCRTSIRLKSQKPRFLLADDEHGLQIIFPMMRPMPATRPDYPLPDRTPANYDGSVSFHAMGYGHNRTNAEFSAETLRLGLDWLLHEMDRGRSLRKHNIKWSPLIRVEEHHMSPRSALRDSNHQRLPVHID